MSRLRMSIDGLGADGDSSFESAVGSPENPENGGPSARQGQPAGAAAGPAAVAAARSPDDGGGAAFRPVPADTSSLGTPSPVGGVPVPSLGDGRRAHRSATPTLSGNRETGISASWQPPRHVSIHQARRRAESRSRPHSPADLTTPRSATPRSASTGYTGTPKTRTPPQALGEQGPAVGHLFKVLVVGNAGVGKTSIIKRYAHDVFSENYQATIGVDFALKVLKVGTHRGQDEIVRLQLWDIAGQEQFGAMTRVYYKGAVGAFVVFDLSHNEDNGDAVRGWKRDIDEKVRMPNGEFIPVVLLASKCDLPHRQWSRGQIDALCEECGFKHWFEVSAKAKINVTEANAYLVTLMLKAEADEEAEASSAYSVASAGSDDIITIPKASSRGAASRSPRGGQGGVGGGGGADQLDESCCV